MAKIDSGKEVKHYMSQSAEWGVRVKTEEVRVPGTIRVLPKSKVIFFRMFEYKTSDPEEIEAIERSPSFGHTVWEVAKEDGEFVSSVQEAVAEKKGKLKGLGKEAMEKAQRASAAEVKKLAKDFKKGGSVGGSLALAKAFVPGARAKAIN